MWKDSSVNVTAGDGCENPPLNLRRQINIRFILDGVSVVGTTTYRFTDVDARFGDRLAGLAVEALRQRGGAVAALSGLQGQLVGHFEGLAQRQDDFICQVLVERRGEEGGVEGGVKRW